MIPRNLFPPLCFFEGGNGGYETEAKLAASLHRNISGIIFLVTDILHYSIINPAASFIAEGKKTGNIGNVSLKYPEALILHDVALLLH